MRAALFFGSLKPRSIVGVASIGTGADLRVRRARAANILHVTLGTYASEMVFAREAAYRIDGGPWVSVPHLPPVIPEVPATGRFSFKWQQQDGSWIGPFEYDD